LLRSCHFTNPLTILGTTAGPPVLSDKHLPPAHRKLRGTNRRRPLYCALEFTGFERKYELYDYDRLLLIARPTPELTENVQSFLASSDAPGELNKNIVEVNYTGRDANRWVVS
jgi:hypothetical protein